MDILASAPSTVSVSGLSCVPQGNTAYSLHQGSCTVGHTTERKAHCLISDTYTCTGLPTPLRKQAAGKLTTTRMMLASMHFSSDAETPPLYQHVAGRL